MKKKNIVFNCITCKVKNMKKILFLINGLGLGNSIRIYAIIERLNKNNTECHIITSGNGKWFFSGLIDNNHLNFIEPINYGSINKKLSTLKTILNVPSIISTINQNFQYIFNIINKFKPDVIVTDSVYLFPKIKKLSIPIVAINNADLTVDYFKKFNKKSKLLKFLFNTIFHSNSYFLEN